jgi:hypothetical protein
MVVVTGCFVDSHKDELEADGRSFVVDNERKNSISSWWTGICEERSFIPSHCRATASPTPHPDRYSAPAAW